jgi:hypothetical protein
MIPRATSYVMDSLLLAIPYNDGTLKKMVSEERNIPHCRP